MEDPGDSDSKEGRHEKNGETDGNKKMNLNEYPVQVQANSTATADPFILDKVWAQVERGKALEKVL